MKKIFVIFYLLIPFFSSAAANPDTVLNIDNLLPKGIKLDHGWKFSAGDNKAWAAPAFNDNNWEAIDPSKPIQFLPMLRQGKICWFRLNLSVSRVMRGKMVAFAINQLGASEIYFNGALIGQYGEVSGVHNRERVYDPRGQPLTVQLGDKAEQVLAIRYSYTRQNLRIGYGESAFSIVLSTPATSWDSFADYIDYYTHRSFVFGVFVLLCILHLLVYVNYPAFKVNLYLSIYAFCQACAFSNALLGTLFSSNSKVVFDAIFYISAPIASAFLLMIVYDLCGQPKKLLFWLPVSVCIIVIPLQFWRNYGPNEIVLNISGVLIHAEIIRVCIIALRLKRQGATLFLIGQSIALLFFCSFSYIDYFYHQPAIFELIEVDLAFLTPAIVVSLLLAREFAQSNLSLKQQLGEVQKLSAKSLEQELEKQQLLASQNQMLENEVSKRTDELSQSLSNLKQTQSQLIQSEKMASLGQLTAGIAHEIQNPLNFVNNFSEVNKELLTELKQELAEKNYEEVGAIADDIIRNEEKINHHGKRADFIVKGMLEHSRTGTGDKQVTDINVLCDEFLKLSYHGLRAKDKSFNAEMITRFDPKLPKVNVSQQDMGRVMLNLFNNAFYAVNQKLKTAGVGYKPEVTVSTSVESGQVAIKVKDNGVGIPDAIKDKIMQPFFTTKPTGEGTGLGLSLTYDMVVKGHGGAIQVNSVGGEGSEFIITLPVG